MDQRNVTVAFLKVEIEREPSLLVSCLKRFDAIDVVGIPLFDPYYHYVLTYPPAAAFISVMSIARAVLHLQKLGLA
jgi:hypothetical protein